MLCLLFVVVLDWTMARRNSCQRALARSDCCCFVLSFVILLLALWIELVGLLLDILVDALEPSTDDGTRLLRRDPFDSPQKSTTAKHPNPSSPNSVPP